MLTSRAVAVRLMTAAAAAALTGSALLVVQLARRNQQLTQQLKAKDRVRSLGLMHS